MKLRKVPYLLFIIVTICLITSCNKECKHQSTDWIIDVEATCTQNGSKHKECTVCHEKLDTEVIESLGHDLVHHEKEDPTCTDIGHKAYDTCTRCSYTTYEELPATGHTESNWIIDKQATCTENGSKHKECTKCHEKLDTEVIESLGHDLVHHEKEDPTCTEKGHKAYDTCTRCSYTTYEEIPELGHIYEDGICTKCGYELTSSDLLYELTSDNTGYLVTGLDYSKYDFNALTIIIPSEYNGLPIVGINDSAFKNRIKIKKIILSNNIIHIGNAAFEGCTRIANIELPNSVISIGSSAFTGCTELTSIVIPNSVTSIGESVFKGCTGLTSITLPFIGDGSNETRFRYIFGEVPTSLKKVIITNATSIGALAFEGCTSLTSIVIPDSVTSIEESAFSGCTGLTSIVIPDGVTSIEKSAFRGCTGLTSIVIPDGVTSIEESAFRGCTGLTSIEIPNSVTSIGLGAFEDCTNLTSITLPFIGNGSDKTHFVYIFGVYYYYDNSQYVPTSLKEVIITGGTSIGYGAFYGCTGLTSIVIPDGVTSIGYGAFKDCTSLTNVLIPNSVTSIGNHAFYNCASLTNMEIPSSVTSIGDHAFYGCTGLTSILIPNSVTSIGESAFTGCTGLTSIEIPTSVTSIGSSAFEGCTGLTSILIPTSVTSIGYSAFSGCTSLTSITLPFIDNGSDKTHFGYIFGAYYYYDNSQYVPTSLKEVIITGGTFIGYGAFYGCTGLTSIEIPNSVTSIGYSAFYWCTGLTSIVVDKNNPEYDSRDNCNAIIETDSNRLITGCKNTKIPNSVTSIGYAAFRGCTGLTSIEIPNSVTGIGESAFEGCTDLTSITLPFIGTHFGYIFGAYYYDDNSQYVPTSLKEVIITGGTSIGESAFAGCTGLTSIVIPTSVTSIGYAAFTGCTGLTSIEIPTSVTSIGLGAFQYCTSLISIKVDSGNKIYDSRDNCNAIIETDSNCLITGCKNTKIPNSVISIGSSAFRGCTGLTSIEIPNSVTGIGESAFEGCTDLTSITLPFIGTHFGYIFGAYYYDDNSQYVPTSLKEVIITGGTSIGYGAFYGCTGLTSIVIPDGVTSIGYGAFKDCTSLTNVLIPNSVTSIGNHAFYNCASLTNMEIPSSVTSIGDHAFYGCTGLTSILIPNSVTSIGEYAFYGCTGLTIYCEALKKPNGWDKYWNSFNCKVVWGYKKI